MGYKNYLLYDKFPKSIKNATSTSDGLMSSEDKARIDSVFEFGLLTPATSDKDGIMSKEDKTKLDGIEENANNYIHPDDPNTRHVTDAQINKWDTQTKYTNSKPMPISLGGLEQGTTFDNMDYSTLINNLLYPYIYPEISGISITPSSTIIEKGNMFTLSRIRFNISSPSLDDNSVLSFEFRSNNTKFYSIETTNKSIDESVNMNINSNTSITVFVNDKINNKSKTFSLINYKFIYPFYYGILSLNETANESIIKSKTKLVQDKGNKTLKFTTSEQKMLFAYPKEYGKLRIIYDANNFNILDTFKVTELNITGADSIQVPYYVYINEASTVSDYNIQFVF